MPPIVSKNFGFLAGHDPLLPNLGLQAERYFHSDPVSALIKLRILGERLAQQAAAYAGLFASPKDPQLELIRRLEDRRILTRDVASLFHSLRKAGNQAAHDHQGTQGEALHQLKVARELSVWFHRTFGSDSQFRPGAFVPPTPPADATADLRAQVAQLQRALDASRSAQELAQAAADEAARQRMSAEERARKEAEERSAFEDIVQQFAQREAEMVDHLARLQADANQAPPQQAAQRVEAIAVRAEAASSAIALDEAATRRLIDEQLREAGWEADTVALAYPKGVRPQKHKQLAIAEWPTETGPADYVLFSGMQAVAVVEAKKQARDVSAAIEQAKRYSRGYRVQAGETLPGGPWGNYKVPFLFASNGRPYLKQLASKSGVWFLDARRPTNQSAALAGWYTPEGLKGLLRQDRDDAHARLKQEPTDYLGLRDYQLRAIHAVEQALERGQRSVLLAMATGTGKTRTCIGLVYRLLKVKRFRRVLFLVDRSALGIQATNAFKETRLEELKTFVDIFDLKELKDIEPEADTKLQIATVQGMVARILYADLHDEAGQPPPIDRYDCIVVDECHRGYLLDRELSDNELTFRNEADYISKYRRVLDHFDCVKIGLTATPVLHTTEIFGAPVYEYGYREAVIDGHLVDHEPPIRITTQLSADGIHWKVGEEMAVYRKHTGKLETRILEDDVHVEIEHFNRQVVTENFNRVVCRFLAERIDPSLDEKTLIFCVTDDHADLVVRLMKEAFAAQYGDVEDDAVLKITGTADRPLELIRRYRNERNPNVAVTVDLLTTGVDIPKISNLVFLRRVRSLTLYHQMLGRATRLCEEIGKEVFRIYDAVDLYSALEPYSDMKPVVVNPQLAFTQLVQELTTLDAPDAQQEVLEQLIAKLDRKRHRLKHEALEHFEAAASMGPTDLLDFLREQGPEVAKAWFTEHPTLATLLDQVIPSDAPLFISHHEDVVRDIRYGFGDSKPPADYIEGFRAYIQSHLNQIPALLLVTQRPRDMTRKQLKELRLALDQAGYSEAKLRTAWRVQTNEDIVASIIGYIRQAALGDALLPYAQRVEQAMKKLLTAQDWKPPQRKWLERIGKQLVQETIVDRESLDQGEFRAQVGGFDRLNKVFEGRLEQILGDLADAVWDQTA